MPYKLFLLFHRFISLGNFRELFIEFLTAKFLKAFNAISRKQIIVSAYILTTDNINIVACDKRPCLAGFYGRNAVKKAVRIRGVVFSYYNGIGIGVNVSRAAPTSSMLAPSLTAPAYCVKFCKRACFSSSSVSLPDGR